MNKLKLQLKKWLNGFIVKWLTIKPSNHTNNLSFGFTLIEVILYVAIVSVFLTALIPFSWSLIGGGAKNSAQQEVFSQARYISERIKYEIRNASSINSPTSGNNGSSLNLNPAPETIIELNGDNIRISTDGGSNYTNLNSKDTKITSLTFTSFTSTDGKTKNIQFTFDIDDNYGSSKKEFDVPLYTVQSSVELRSNTVLN